MPTANRETTMDALEVKAGEVSRMLKLLANKKRILVLCRLTAGEMTVTALASAVGLSPSALSQHLARMRSEGLVGFRRENQTLFYFIADPQANEVLFSLKRIYCPDMAH